MPALLRVLAAAALICALVMPAQAAPIKVVATFSILGDLIAQVGGERVAVHTLVGPDADAHAYQPRPSDARAIGGAQLVVANGLGFDSWIERLARSAGYRGPLLVASAGIAPLAAADEDHGDEHGRADPHAWQDVSNARRYVANIAAALARLDPQGVAAYRANAARYDAELAAVDRDIRSAFATLPEGRRKVVTTHDAFGYFAHAYGVRFLAPVGVSSSAEPGAGDVARLIRQLRREQVPAVFLENVNDPRLLERIGRESGARIGGTLYSDALSAAGGPAPTYAAMMRHNLATLIAGLK